MRTIQDDAGEEKRMIRKEDGEDGIRDAEYIQLVGY